MRHLHRLALFRTLVALLCVAGVAPTLAAVPLASREADRQAKFAVPASSEAFVYVYRGDDRSDAPLAVVLNGRDTAQLAPRTFVMWRVRPGRIQLSATGTTSVLSLSLQGGRVYYAELSRLPSGVPVLRQVSFPVGRTAIHRARLIAQTGVAARAAPPVAAVRPAPPPRRGAEKLALMLKPGAFKLATESQTLNLAGGTFPLQFDTTSSSVFAIEGEWFVRPDISFGLEYVSFSNDYTTTGTPPNGSTDARAFLVNAKRYFLPGSAWQPYVGAGLGVASASLSGPITGTTSGFALQLVGGLQWRQDRFALRAEYKYLKAETEDDNSQKVDMSGGGPFLAIGFFF
jgi:opacity protein-like surface antigen